jgi:hypothetical protein
MGLAVEARSVYLMYQVAERIETLITQRLSFG